MSYSDSFRYCKHCRKSTVHFRREVEREGERHEEYQCTQCDTESSRPLNTHTPSKRTPESA